MEWFSKKTPDTPPAGASSASSRLFFLPSSSFRAGDRARFVLRIEISFGALLSGRIVKARRFIQYRPHKTRALFPFARGLEARELARSLATSASEMDIY
jgi:hypothetical protein